MNTLLIDISQNWIFWNFLTFPYNAIKQQLLHICSKKWKSRRKCRRCMVQRNSKDITKILFSDHWQLN